MLSGVEGGHPTARPRSRPPRFSVDKVDGRGYIEGCKRSGVYFRGALCVGMATRLYSVKVRDCVAVTQSVWSLTVSEGA